MRQQRTVALAVSGHGFGHAVRCAEVARALLRRGARVMVRSDAPLSLFPGEVEWIASPGWPLDIGVVQRDGLEMDIDEKRRQWCQFARDFYPRARAEGELLQESGVDIVLGDIPPMAFAAAACAGIPSLGLTNFTWDWIYSAWPDFDDIIGCVRTGYSSAGGLLQLPLHGDCGAFESIEDVPLIARKATRSREEMRSELGLPLDARVVLISFGGFSAQGLNHKRLADLREYVFVAAPPLRFEDPPANVLALNESPADYVSLLAACDVVITKPGYGIVADCLANRVAVLFTDRGPFREYDVLAEGLTRLGRARYVAREDLLQAELRPHLETLEDCQTPWTEQPLNGADVVADRVVQRTTI